MEIIISHRPGTGSFRRWPISLPWPSNWRIDSVTSMVWLTLLPDG
jgi:hypothetical protein